MRVILFGWAHKNFSMSPNQLTLLTNLINNIHTQIPEKDRIKLARSPHVGRAKEFGGEIYQKVKNTLDQGLFNHLKTAQLDRVDYWAELIIELIWAREKGLDLDVKTRYSWWINWKIQNTHLTLENKP